MKLRIIAAAIALLSPAAASASGLTQAIVPPSPVAATSYDWSGFYVGLFGGAAENKTKSTDITGEEFGGSTPGAALSLSGKDAIWGLTSGYNFQSGAWVYGPEIELGSLSIDKTFVINGDDGVRTKYSNFGALTGRLGYSMDRTLIYAKGGLAIARIKNGGGEYDGIGSEDSGGGWGFDGNEAGVGSSLRQGWALGVGIEHAISQKFSVKAEYLYSDFGNKTYGTFVSGFQPFKFHDRLHMLKIGVNYRF